MTTKNENTVEPAPPPSDSELTRAERLAATLGEKILVERLHRVLDDGSLAAHVTFCDTLLPYLQGLVALLPRLIHEDSPSGAIEAIQTLNASVQARGVSLHDAMAESIRFHDLLRQQVAALADPDDRPIITALSRLSQALLEVEQDALMTYQHSAPDQDAAAAGVRLDHIESHTGVAVRAYFEERFGEEILRAQRLQRALTLILLKLDGAALPSRSNGDTPDDAILRDTAALLLARTRGFDLVAHTASDEFALLLPETSRTGAAAVLSRVTPSAGEQPAADQPPPFRVGIGVYPQDGQTVHQLMEYAQGALQQLS